MKLIGLTRESVFEVVGRYAINSANRRVIIEVLYSEFGIIINSSAIRYIQKNYFNEDGSKKIAADNEKMDKWRKEYDIDRSLSEEEQYAEDLNLLASNKMDSNDFNAIYCKRL